MTDPAVRLTPIIRTTARTATGAAASPPGARRSGPLRPVGNRRSPRPARNFPSRPPRGMMTRVDWSLPPRDPRAPRGPAEPRPPVPRVVVGALLVVAVLGAALAGPWVSGPPREPASVHEEQPGQPPEVDPEPDWEPPVEGFEDLPEPPIDLGWVGTTVLVLLAVVAGALLVRALRRRDRRGRQQAAVPGEQGMGATAVHDVEVARLRSGVDEAVERLDAPAAPADAIVAAWVALEEAAARSGFPRDPAHTPTEFTLEVLDRARADHAAARTLLGLYLRARFSDEPLGPDDVVAARRALDVIAAGLVPGAHASATVAPPAREGDA